MLFFNWEISQSKNVGSMKKKILCWLIKFTYSLNSPVVSFFQAVHCRLYSKKRAGGKKAPFIHLANVHGVSHHDWCYGTFKDK